MFKNFFKTAWRNLIKDKQFTLLNLVGLSTGLACALLIWLWVRDELHMDKYNPDDSRLYQVMQNIKEENGIETTANTAGLLANALASEMPEVEHAATVVPASWFSSKGIVSFGNTRLQTGGQFVSRGYFDIFSCDFLEGGKKGVSTDRHSIAISDELAMKLFHSTKNAIGKTVDWNLGEFNGSYLVTGVFKKNPLNASERFDMLFNFDLFVEKRPGMLEWGNSDPRTYILLKKGTNPASFNNKIKNFIETKEQHSGKTLFIRRFSDQYLYAQYKDGVLVGGRIEYVRLFTIIAIFLLVIACINFMNLSTAKAAGRIKEVGIKKAIGAGRGTLIWQYLGESVLMSFLSLVFAVILIVLLLPAFNSITGKQLTLHAGGTMMLSVAGITLLTGLAAGSYPALYISGFEPALVLKGKLKTSAAELLVRKGLVVFQFSLSVTAIIGVMTVYRQIHFIETKNLGYNRDNVIEFTIPLADDSLAISNAASFINEIGNISGVISAGSHSHNLLGDHGGIGGFSWPGKDPSKDMSFANLEIGRGFLQTMGIRIKEGRNFSANATENSEIIFNASAIKAMGLKDPVGKKVRYWGMEPTIVGVAEDFNFESLYQSVKPAFFRIFPVGPNIAVRIKAGTEQQTIAQIGKLYASFNKGLPFDYKFLDEQYQALYASEERVAVLSRYFAGLAILISCLGLFGLAAFTAQKRRKEIGVRKVIGASVTSIAAMLSGDFLKLVALALLVAFPVSWWLMNNWLRGFAYRISITLSVFLIAGMAAIIITLLTVSFQSVKAAMANPVKSLKAE
jgi:ABC-type antimicrobial peptide transport system permease subunit